MQVALRAGELLLAADRDFPNGFSLVTGRAPLGSWWADPAGGTVYAVLKSLEADRKVLRVRRLDGKWTYLHRSLWPLVLRVVERRRTWQSHGLSPLASRLLERVDRLGVLDLQDRANREGATLRSAGKAARELERRLLVVSHEIHTSAGLHAKRLESWRSWKRRHRAWAGRLGPREVRRRLEDAMAALTPPRGRRVALPWTGMGLGRRPAARRGEGAR